MLAKILTQSTGITNYWFGENNELDAALILSGYVEHTPNGRYCFQTTYLNECYKEYYEHTGPFKIIWIIRNPYSVIYSQMYNWGPGALDRNFRGFASKQLRGFEKMINSVLGTKGISPVRQASYLYNAKTMQLIELVNQLDKDRIFVVDYDDLIREKDAILKRIYQFISLEYLPEYGEKIHSKSLDKKNKLTSHELRVVKDLCEPAYQDAQKLKSVNPIVG
jgi:hypothetical protein